MNLRFPAAKCGEMKLISATSTHTHTHTQIREEYQTVNTTRVMHMSGPCTFQHGAAVVPAALTLTVAALSHSPDPPQSQRTTAEDFHPSGTCSADDSECALRVAALSADSLSPILPIGETATVSVTAGELRAASARTQRTDKVRVVLPSVISASPLRLNTTPATSIPSSTMRRMIPEAQRRARSHRSPAIRLFAGYTGWRM